MCVLPIDQVVISAAGKGPLEELPVEIKVSNACVRLLRADCMRGELDRPVGAGYTGPNSGHALGREAEASEERRRALLSSQYLGERPIIWDRERRI